MKEVKTKRGTIAFGEENILLEENYLDYFRNLYRELWEEGEHHHMLTMFLLVFAITYSAVMFVSVSLLVNLNYLLGFITTATAVYALIWSIQRKRGFTTEGKISYEDIKQVKFVEGKNWFTCPRFIIEYGQDKRRYISMHSHMIPGVDDRIEEIKSSFESKDVEIV